MDDESTHSQTVLRVARRLWSSWPAAHADLQVFHEADRDAWFSQASVLLLNSYIASILCAATAHAQQRFHVIDLGLINQPAPRNLELVQPDVHLPFRINSTGQVALYRSQGTPGQQNLTYTPLLWLPEEHTSIGLDASPINPR